MSVQTPALPDPTTDPIPTNPVQPQKKAAELYNIYYTLCNGIINAFDTEVGIDRRLMMHPVGESSHGRHMTMQRMASELAIVFINEHVVPVPHDDFTAQSRVFLEIVIWGGYLQFRKPADFGIDEITWVFTTPPNPDRQLTPTDPLALSLRSLINMSYHPDGVDPAHYTGNDDLVAAIISSIGDSTLGTTLAFTRSKMTFTRDTAL